MHCLFQELKPETRRDVVALYDKCCIAYKTAIQAGKQQHGPKAVAAEMANLEEALQWNADAVKNLKYELTPRGRSVPTGIFWSSERVWVVPLMHPLIVEHQITPKTSRYTRCSMSMLPNVSINGRIRSSGQLGRWWYSISPCRNSECVRRFTVFAFNQRS